MLAARLAADSPADPVVLGLPRGGLPVAAPVAQELDAPLDVLVVRKLGVPGHEEVAMGAVGESGAIVRNEGVIAAAGVEWDAFQRVEQRERAAVEERVARLRGVRPPVDLRGRNVVIVDDGIATGATVRAACAVARARGAASVVVAVPVASPDAVAALDRGGDADAVVCLDAPEGFMAVGMHYLDFRQVDDASVAALLAAHA
jgi:predicted phosphoribosyltransferase